MWRRRLLFGFFLAMLALCAGGWVLSLWYDTGLVYRRHRSWSAESSLGCLQLEYCIIADVSGWDFWAMKEGYKWQESAVADYDYGALGFSADCRGDDVHKSYRLLIPFWFPTALAALGTFWSWRRIRRAEQLRRRGFPVDAPAPPPPAARAAK